MATTTVSHVSESFDKLHSTTQNALLIQSSGGYTLSSSVATPKLTPTTILVRVRAVGLQPVDAKMPEHHGSALNGCIGGYDFAGEVVAIGDEVQRQQEQSGRSPSALLRLQDRVAGMVFGGNPQQPGVGAFCELVLADPRFVLRIPHSMTFEQGASLGTAVATAGMALFESLGLQLPPLSAATGLTEQRRAENGARDEWALVLGGSSSCGTMAIQLLKLSGYRVIATASPRNFQLVKGYGADVVVDYHSPNHIADIKRVTNSSLGIALDCVSEGESMKTCYEAIGSSGGKYTGLNPFPMQLHTRDDVKPHWVFVLTMFGQPILIKGPLRRAKLRPKDVEFEVDWFSRAQRLLDQGLLRTHPVRVNGQGLQQVIDGINEVRLCKVSGEKLVYQV